MAEEIVAGVVSRVPMLEQWAAVLIIVFGMGLVALMFSVRWLGKAIMEHAKALMSLKETIESGFARLGAQVDAAHAASDRKAENTIQAIHELQRCFIKGLEGAIEKMFDEFPQKLFREAERQYPLDPNNPEHLSNPRSRWNKLPAKD